MSEYRIFTTQFDVETTGDALTRDLPWGRRVGMELLSAQYQRKTARLRKRAIIPEIESSVPPAVTLLVDHSGSMKGKRTDLARFAVETLAHILCHHGIDHEILGFTTVHWRGGQSRNTWLEAGKPGNPGRLNDSLHIVYKPFSDATRSVPTTLQHMHRPDLLKENIDGEALLWAAGRLLQQPHRKRHLIVISDGAPVDDSTLNENGTRYLWNHLKSVISDLENSVTLDLHAIGIQFEFARLYSDTINIWDIAGAARDVPAFLGHLLQPLA